MSINIVDPENTSPVKTDIKYISSYTEHAFAGISISSRISGHLRPAVIQYAYILYNKYGKSSNLSPLSNMRVVQNSGKGQYQSIFGVHKDELSENGFSLYIPETTSSGYQKIKIFRITYSEIGQDPKIDVIDEGNLTGSAYSYNDIGNSISTMSYAEFLALQKIPIIPTEIESKNDYLFASNIKYQINASKELLQQFASLDLSSQISSSGYLDMNSSYSSSSPSWNSHTGTYINWEFVQQYGDVKSLRRDEIYRYGIVLYDKYENAWPVKWICDLRTPPINESLNKRITNNELEFSKLGVEFTVKWNQITSYFVGNQDYFTGFEIVRCDRTDLDRFTITQGIIGRPFECYDYLSTTWEEIDDNGTTIGNSKDMLCPTGFMSTDRIVAYTDKIDGHESAYGVSSNNIVLFASPEICYQHDDILNLVNKNSNLQLKVAWQDYHVLDTTQIRDIKYYINTMASSWTTNTTTYIKPLSDNSIPGMAFIKRRVYLGDDGSATENPIHYDSQNHKKFYALWVATRFFPLLHEPINYNITTSTDLDEYTGLDSDAYYREPNQISMRKTIYNYIPLCNRSNFQGFVTEGSNVTLPNVTSRTCGISNIRDVKIPKYNEFANGNKQNYRNNTSVIGSKTFVPWSVPTIVSWNNLEIYNHRQPYKEAGISIFNNVEYGDTSDDHRVLYPVSAVGKSLLIQLSSNWFNDSTVYDLTATVCNLRRTGISPYGGTSDSAKQNSVYYSHGYYVNNPSSSETVLVYDGDCFVQTFRYNAAKTYYNPDIRYAPNMTTIYSFPIETDIDIDHELGWSSKYQSAGYNMYIQDEAAVLRGYTQEEPCYIANTAYNTNRTARYFTGQDKDDLENVNYDYRVCYSNQKQNNESFDSWLNFKSANYIDVDTRYGQITDLRLFKDTLLFWQDNAVGVLSVNERTIIQDANDTNIILGNGDVLQRYDYLTTEYGMKPNQYVDGQSNTTLYWWDGYRKEILSYSGGQSVTPMNKLKTIDNYINNRDEFTYPSIAYDVKYNEVLFNVVGYDTLAYSEVVQQFISDYDVQFKHRFNFYDKLMLLDDTKMYEWNKSPQNSTLTPYLKFVVNPQSLYNNVYDIMQIAGRLYGGNTLTPIQMVFKTPLKQSMETS